MSDASLAALLRLTSPPVAITFTDAPPSLRALEAQLAVIVRASEALEQFHRARA